MMDEVERKLFYPIEVRIIKDNPYGLPKGKVFRAKRKEGDASPFPIELYGDGIYQMMENEVEIIEEGPYELLLDTYFCSDFEKR